MLVGKTKRPRNVDTPRAAAILYGDWGTSKAYVIGLAFAIAGYSSFWLIAAMCALTALVGFNYMIVCRHYPDGGGVYASVRHRSEIISIVGAKNEAPRWSPLVPVVLVLLLGLALVSAFRKTPHPDAAQHETPSSAPVADKADP